MKAMFGGLLAAGWTLDDMLSLTIDQLSFAAECVVKHKVEMMNMILEPVMAGLGSGYKGGKVQAKKARSRQKKTTTREQRDADLVNRIAAVGLPIGTTGG